MKNTRVGALGRLSAGRGRQEVFERVRRLSVVAVVGFCVLTPAFSAAAEDSGAAATAATPAASAAVEEKSEEEALVSAGVQAGQVPSVGLKPAPPPADSPSLPKVLQLARQVNDLLAGKLAVELEPSALFEIQLDDALAVEVEQKRLQALVDATGPDEKQGGAAKDDSASPDASVKKVAQTQDPSPAAEKPDEAEAASPPKTPELSLWEARRALDRARLAFLSLSADERRALLARHQERQQEASGSKQELNAADAEAAAAAQERAAAIEAARTARSEAVRSVHEEYARLLDVTRLQAEFGKLLIQSQEEANARYDAALKVHRQISELVAARANSFRNEEPLDADYVQLQKRLGEARSLEGAALSKLNQRGSRVPRAGEDALAELPADVDRSKVDAERKHIAARARELSQRETEVEREIARLLMTEIETLNRLRLSMLPYLTDSKRAEVTGFTATGLDQARSEMTQVILTLRYHFEATKSWALGIRSGTGRGESAWTASLLALRWLLPIGVFVWWRRRAEDLLGRWTENIAENDRQERGSSAPASWPLVVARFLRRIHRPLEWLLLLWAVRLLLPETMRNLLEVELASTVLRWTWGGSLVVMAIDALSSAELKGPRRMSEASLTAHLRLKSLRLAGRTVVVFGLLLGLSSELVGKGTIYRWVFSLTWMVALPVLLVIIQWWKPTIFERIEVLRRKSPTQRWVLVQREGAMSFIAAIVGGVELFAVGVGRTVRGWAVTFTVVRRVLAYLFRRGMSKKVVAQRTNHKPLSREVFSILGPEHRSSDIVPSEADDQVDDVISRIQAAGGGVYAVIGERGRGKTTIMQRIAESDERITVVSCGAGGVQAFKRSLNIALELEEDAPFEVAAGKLEYGGDESAILIDDAQRLILPMMGGLHEFDSVLELARVTSSRCTWIFAIDEALWRFLERARGARPLFDDAIFLSPWSEDAIVRLLRRRNAAAGINPDFSSLLPELPDDADEIDIKEALQQTEENYFRLLWDYASGNPGVALHFWRNSLELDGEGKAVARIFRAPEADDLEGLPDSTVFVLRAAVQLGHASLDHVCAATSLPRAQVQDALRYGAAKGYFVHTEDTYFITWDWFRAITRFLKRRHLLFGS